MDDLVVSMATSSMGDRRSVHQMVGGTPSTQIDRVCSK